jgi:AcrR family transcriptional regulator
MGRRTKQAVHSPDEIREMVLATARRIVAKQGLGALSTRKVASSIGYAVGSLYLVFRNLDDLILHVNGATLDDLYQTLETTAVRIKDPEACLLALARAYIQFAFNNRSLWTLVFEHPAPLRRPGWYQDKVKRTFGLIEERLHGIAPQRPAKDLKLAAHALWCGVHGVSVLGLADRLDESGLPASEKLAVSLVTNYLVGFKQESRSRR